jgi:hypothetical protein
MRKPCYIAIPFSLAILACQFAPAHAAPASTANQHVAFVSPAVPATRQPIGTHFLRISNDNAVQQVDKWMYRLDDGTAILHPLEDIVIMTPQTKAYIARHAVVLIEVDQGRTNILDLHDAKMRSVRAVSGAKEVVLSPGAGAAFGQTGNFEQQLMRDGLARRKVRIWADEVGRSAMTYEFSTVQAYSTRGLLSELAQSSERSDKRAMDEIVKTAAALSLATASHGAYQAQN